MQKTRVNPRANGPMQNMHAAVKGIVDATRAAIEKDGGPKNAELRIPVIFGGEDMRCTVEAGPSVAMRNAVEHASMIASGAPYKYPGEDVVRDAVQILAIYASEIKDDSCDRSGTWKSEKDRKWFEQVSGAMRELDAFLAGVKG